MELVLDASAIGAELGQHGRETPGPILLAMLVLGVVVEAPAVVVSSAEVFGQLGDLTPVQLGQPAPHVELIAGGPDEVEQRQSADGAGEGGIGTGAPTEPDLGGQIGGMAEEPVGVVVERRCESAHDPRARGTEDAEPIVFDVGRTRIVPDAVDVGFVPGKDGEEVGQCGRGHDGLRGTENEVVENDRDDRGSRVYRRSPVEIFQPLSLFFDLPLRRSGGANRRRAVPPLHQNGWWRVGSGSMGMIGAAVRRAADLVTEAERVVVLTGAGISTDSGIPDFRGPNGLWTRDPDAEKASNIRSYVADADLRRRSWARRAEGTLWATVAPNAGHRALVSLEARGKLDVLVTQNVDELHQLAGSDPARVIEIHGTTRKAACLDCGTRWPMEEILDRVRAGEDDPRCVMCTGIVKSATVSFGQSLVAADLRAAEEATRRCDLLLAVGTSLQVYPVNNLVPLASAMGASVVIVNAEPTPMDHYAAAIVRGSISQVLPVIVGEQSGAE